VIVEKHVPIILEVVVVDSVVAEVAVVVAEVIVTDAQNQVILHVIVPNPIHVVDKAVVHQINKVEMMMKIKQRITTKYHRI